jgi:hypothetical protein
MRYECTGCKTFYGKDIKVNFLDNNIILSIFDEGMHIGSASLTKEEGKYLMQFLQQIVYCTNESANES